MKRDWKATTDQSPIYSVYLIECVTPFHFYVGMTNNVERRIGQHVAKLGNGAYWTEKHGVKSHKVVASNLTEDEALSVELKVYKIMKKQGLYIKGAYDCSTPGTKIDKKFKAQFPVRR